MNLAEFAVKAPVKISMIFLLVILLGWISLNRLPINLFPDIQAPRITTEVRTRGLSPQEVERRIAQPFERALYTVRGVTDVKSISRADAAILVTEFTWDSSMDYAFLDVKKAVSEVQRNIDPADIDTVSVLRYDPNARPIITVALVGGKDTNQQDLRQLAVKMLEPQFERIEGVASVVVTGGEEKELVVQLDETKMLADKLEVKNIVAAIQNANVNASGGWVEEGSRRYLLKAVGELRSPEEISEITVGRRGDVPIKLAEIASVQYEPKETKSIVRFDGKPAVGLAFYKESLGNTVGVAQQVRDDLERLQKLLPKGLQLVVAQDQSQFIRDAIGEVKSNAVVGGILAIVVLFLFLRDLRSTLIIGLAIPISIIATFNLMYFLNLSLNLMTLGGLALGVGMLVDNAIVALENIHRLHGRGVGARTAAIRGTHEVAGALIASTLTTVVVFLPIIYVHGVAGLLFKDQAWTVSFSLLASLVVALLLIPLMAYRMYQTVGVGGAEPAAVQPEKSAGEIDTIEATTSDPTETAGTYIRWYSRAIRWALHHRAIVFALAIGTFFLMAIVARRLPRSFFPRLRSVRCASVSCSRPALPSPPPIRQ